MMLLARRDTKQLGYWTAHTAPESLLESPKRVAILGCGGSGKTYVSGLISRRLGVPVTHLDALYYDADWQPAIPEEFLDRQRAVLTEPAWVIEGNYASSMSERVASADLIVLLDVRALRCYSNILRRTRRFRSGQHRESGVFNRFDLGFARYIWSYRRRSLPKARNIINSMRCASRTVTLKSPRDVEAFLLRMFSSPRVLSSC